eukprot:5330478-Pyramimonas_sp.AAC.1
MCGAGNRVSRVHVAEGWASLVQGVPEERGQGFVQGVRRHARPGCRPVSYTHLRAHETGAYL